MSETDSDSDLNDLAKLQQQHAQLEVTTAQLLPSRPRREVKTWWAACLPH
jgi:hypothetical protein